MIISSRAISCPRDVVELVAKHVDVVSLASDLVGIRSDPPDHPEQAVADYLKELFSKHGLAYIDQPTPLGKERQNLLVVSEDIDATANLPSHRNGLLFSAHMDVVPPGDEGSWINGETGPWIDDGRLHGRGATDMKGGMAACIAAFLAIKERNLMEKSQGKLIGLLFTVDEEMTMTGAKTFANSPLARHFGNIILPEPTLLKPMRAHKGYLFARFTVKGKAAHGSVPERGINAIKLAMRLYSCIESQFEIDRQNHMHSVLGPPTINLGVFKGGERPNVVPDSCTFCIDRRITEGEDPEAIVKSLVAITRDFKRPDIATIECKIINKQPPYIIDEKNVLLGFLTGMLGPAEVMHGYTEAGIYANYAGIPTVILGPGSIDGAHVANEMIAIEDLEKAANIYETIMLQYLEGKIQA